MVGGVADDVIDLVHGQPKRSLAAVNKRMQKGIPAPSDQNFVACPNQDTVYGAGYQHLDTPDLIAVLPRIFMDDTAQDRAAVKALINQVVLYPLGQVDETIKTKDSATTPAFPAPSRGKSRSSTEAGVRHR